MTVRRLASWSQAVFFWSSRLRVLKLFVYVFACLQEKMAERSRDRSSSTESQPKFPECSHFRRRNDNHRRCQRRRLNDGLPLCTQDSPCRVCQDWLPEAWTAQAKAIAQRNRRKAAAKLRWWTTRWNYTHLGTLFLPSVSSPRIRPSPSGLRQSQVDRNPSPWLPASRRWNGPAPTGRTTAGRGLLNASKGTAKKDVTSLRGITRRVVTALAAAGERESGPGQVPLVGPARVDVPSPAVSRRYQTPVHRALPLAIISIILRASVDPSHHLHHGRLQTASLSQVTARDDERAPTGRVGRLSPDGMSSYLLRRPRPLRNALSRWLPRRRDRFILNRPQQFQSRPR